VQRKSSFAFPHVLNWKKLPGKNIKAHTYRITTFSVGGSYWKEKKNVYMPHSRIDVMTGKIKVSLSFQSLHALLEEVTGIRIETYSVRGSVWKEMIGDGLLCKSTVGRDVT